MVKNEIIFACLLMVSTACAPSFTWEKVKMDGHRTGVSAVFGNNADEALGHCDSVYHAPNGKIFPLESSTARVASSLIEVQPRMAYLKEIVGYSAKEMRMSKTAPETELMNWAADAFVCMVKKATGKPVDISIVNRGGIRVDMPIGEVLMEDITSMFPFHNYLCRVETKGSELRKAFDFMASTKFHAMSGVRIVAKDGKIVSVLIGGKPLDDNKVYSVATVDFLLDGGDNIYLGRNSVKTEKTKYLVMDQMIPYVKSLDVIKSEKDGRVTVL